MTPDGSYLHVSDSKGSLALYEGSQSYRLIRLLPNALAKLEHITHNSIALDDNGRRLACIGPSPFVVTVFDARSLDEVSIGVFKHRTFKLVASVFNVIHPMRSHSI